METSRTVFCDATNTWAIELKETGEALGLMVEHIRKTTAIKSLICGHFVDNPASGRVMEKCGFIPT